MSDAGAAAGSMSCPACGKRYPWKASLTGRKVRCACGTVFEAALDLSPADDDDDDGLGPADAYDVADDGPPAPVPQTVMARPAPTSRPVHAPVEPQRGNVLSYRRTDPADVAAVSEREQSILRHFYVPALLLVVGLVLWTMRMIHRHDVPGGAAQAVVMVVLGIVVNVGLLTAAVSVAGALLGADFGPWKQAALKVAAIGTLVGAIGGIVSGIDLKGGNGPIVAIHAVVVLYWILFYAFFDLDVQESLMTVVIVAAFQIAAFCIVFQ